MKNILQVEIQPSAEGDETVVGAKQIGTALIFTASKNYLESCLAIKVKDVFAAGLPAIKVLNCIDYVFLGNSVFKLIWESTDPSGLITIRFVYLSEMDHASVLKGESMYQSTKITVYYLSMTFELFKFARSDKGAKLVLKSRPF